MIAKLEGVAIIIIRIIIFDHWRKGNGTGRYVGVREAIIHSERFDAGRVLRGGRLEDASHALVGAGAVAVASRYPNDDDVVVVIAIGVDGICHLWGCAQEPTIVATPAGRLQLRLRAYRGDACQYERGDLPVQVKTRKRTSLLVAHRWARV